jgi:hypothetical protein
MKKTSYNVSDASIKRYWKMWETNRKQDDRLYPKELFDKWCDEENFSGYAHYDAMRMIVKEDFALLRDIITDYRETKRKLNTIADAFEIINDLNS